MQHGASWCESADGGLSRARSLSTKASMASWSPRAENGVVLQGWLQKESRWLRKWKKRYVLLTADAKLRTFTCEPPPSYLPLGSPRKFESVQGAISLLPTPREDAPMDATSLDSPIVHRDSNFSMPSITSAEEVRFQMTEDIDVKGGRCQARGVSSGRVLASDLFGAITAHRFVIHVGNRWLTFAAENLHKRDEWIQALCTAMTLSHPHRIVTPRSIGTPERTNSISTVADLADALSGRVSPRATLKDAQAFPISSQSPPLQPHSWSSLPAAKSPNMLAIPLGGASSSSCSQTPRTPDGFQSSRSPESALSSSRTNLQTPFSARSLAAASSSAPQLQSNCALASPTAALDGPSDGSSKGKGKGKGKLPPPPPGGKGAAQAKASMAKKSQVSKAAPASLPIGRRLSLKSNQIHAEVFSGLLHNHDRDAGELQIESAVSVDLSALRDAFAPQKLEDQPQRKRSKGETTIVELLPRHIAQNIGIVLARIRVDTNRLASALLHLNPSECAISADESARLLDVWPSPQQLQPIVDFAKSRSDPLTTQLRDVERSIQPLVMLPRMGPRLRLIVLMRTIDDRVNSALGQLTTLQNACQELRTSPLLRDLIAVVLVVFNYVNYGTEIGSANQLCGVDVQSLLRLRETKAYKGEFPNFNMLHFVVRQLLRRQPDLTISQLTSELPSLPQAVTVGIDRLRRELAHLQADFAFVRGEIVDHRRVYELGMMASDDMQLESEGSPPTSAASKLEPTPRLLNSDAMMSVSTPDLSMSLPAPPPAATSPRKAQADESLFNDLVLNLTSRSSLDGRPPSNPASTFLGRMWGSTVEYWRSASAWMSGMHFVGDKQVSSSTAPVELVLADDDKPPPPGWLWLYRHNGQWQQCWGEIHASLLLLYRYNGRRCSGTSCIVLSGARITQFDDSRASEAARALSEIVPHGFEVSNPRTKQVFRLCAGSMEEVHRWLAVVRVQVHNPGVGYMTVSRRGSRSYAAREFYCYIHRGQILGFKRAQHSMTGRRPDRSWPLVWGTVHALHGAKGHGVSGSIRSTCVSSVDGPYGFEIQQPGANSVWEFACTSAAEEHAWMHEIDRGIAQAVQPKGSAATLVESMNESSVFNAVEASNESLSHSVVEELKRELKLVLPEKPGSNELLACTPRSRTLSGNNSQNSGPQDSDDNSDSGSSSEESESESTASLSSTAPIQNISASSAVATAVAPLIPRLQLNGKAIQQAKQSIGGKTHDENAPVYYADGNGVRRKSLLTPVPVDAMGRLEELERKLQAEIERWGEAASKTDDECGELLVFFGVERPSSARTGAAVAQMLESLDEFTRQLHSAWSELEKFQKAAPWASERVKKRCKF